jgi:subtilase family serine protease
MDADPVTGKLIGGTPLGGSPITNPGTWQYTEHKYGGTSLSAPLFAGVQALAQQARGGKPFGFANLIMYERAASPYQLPDGNVPTAVSYRPDSQGGSTPTLYNVLASQLTGGPSEGLVPPDVGTGFDTETGLGTPTAAYLRSFIGS